MAMWGLGIGWELRLFFFALFIILCRQNVYSKPLPEQKSSDGTGGTVTQTGEPSHFQVDDKAAEIEVNANPAGVKVNAKPASLQVVAKPGTPAIPIFHPSIHLAPHYSAPPLIHHHPASFYQGWGHGGFPWFNGGLKRNRLPVSKESNKRARRRTHKSDIPHSKDNRKGGKSNKRQFIQTNSQFIQPSQLGSFLGYYPSQGLGALGVAPQVNPGTSLLSGLGGLAAFSPLSQYGPSTPAQASLSPQTSLQESALSSNMISVRPQNPLYTRAPLLPSSSYEGLFPNVGGQQGQLYSGLLGQQAVRPYDSGLMGSRQAPGYARGYVPYAPLSQLYANQFAQPRYTGMPGYGQMSPRSILSLLGLQQLASGPRVFSRSKVPGSKESKKPKRSLDKVNSDSHLHRAFKRQILLQPPGTADDVMQEELTEDLLKRQLIMNPQLQALTNQQQLQNIATQQAALRNFVAQRPLQVPQSLLQQSTMSNLPETLTYNPLQAPLSMLTSSYISPIETPSRTQLLAPRTQQPSRLATAPFARQVMPYRFANERPSMSMLGLSQLIGSREGLESSYQANSPFHRKSFERPLYRRRLARPHDYDDEETRLPEEDGPIGEESVSQGNAYTQELLPGHAGKTLLDTSHVGFGPITVEAKTAEGERLAPDEERRNDVQRPTDSQKPINKQ